MYFVVICSTVFNKRQVSVVDFNSFKQMNTELKQLMHSRNNPICFFANNKRNLAALDEVISEEDRKYIRKYYTEVRIKLKQSKYSRAQCRDISYIEKLRSGMYLLHSEERNLIVPEFNLARIKE